MTTVATTLSNGSPCGAKFASRIEQGADPISSTVAAGAPTDFARTSSTSSRSAQSTSGGASFADILVSTTGGGTDTRAADRATAAAASEAAEDVSTLAKLSGAFTGSAPNGTLGVETIDSSGNVICDAKLDPNGNLSVFGSSTFGGAASTIGMSLSPQSDGGTWYAHASAELAQASYELNSLINQSTAAPNGQGTNLAV